MGRTEHLYLPGVARTKRRARRSLHMAEGEEVFDLGSSPSLKSRNKSGPADGSGGRGIVYVLPSLMVIKSA